MLSMHRIWEERGVRCHLWGEGSDTPRPNTQVPICSHGVSSGTWALEMPGPFLCFTHFGGPLVSWGREGRGGTQRPTCPSHPPPLRCSQPWILCLAAPATAPVASCWPRAWHFGAAQQMLAEPVPHVQAEVRPREAEALAEGDIPQGEGRPQPSQVETGAWGRFLRPPICSETPDGSCWALATAVQAGDPAPPHESLGVGRGSPFRWKN